MGARLRRAPALAVERERRTTEALHERLRRAPLLLVERKRAALENATSRLRVLSPRSSEVEPGQHVDVQVAEGGFGARVEAVK